MLNFINALQLRQQRIAKAVLVSKGQKTGIFVPKRVNLNLRDCVWPNVHPAKTIQIKSMMNMSVRKNRRLKRL